MEKSNGLLSSLAVVALVALTACSSGEGAKGGGGLAAPAPEPPVPPPIEVITAEGAYAGSTSGGVDLEMLVLEDDTVWGLYELNGLLVGFFQGQGASTDGSFAVADLREYDFRARVTRPGTLSASFFADVSIQGTIVPEIGVQTSFTASTDAFAGYDYAQPAAPEAIGGTWNGFYRDGSESGAVDIAANGAITAITSLGCSYSGTVTPRLSGKNVYDVRITFGGAPCELPGQVATGIAIVVDTPTGASQLQMAIIDLTREFGTTFIGMR